jgi:hypothetical protein
LCYKIFVYIYVHVLYIYVHTYTGPSLLQGLDQTSFKWGFALITSLAPTWSIDVLLSLVLCGGGREEEFICFNDTTEGPRALGSAIVAVLVSNLCDVISDYVGFESDPASTVKSVWASVLSMMMILLLLFLQKQSLDACYVSAICGSRIRSYRALSLGHARAHLVRNSMTPPQDTDATAPF